MKLPAVRKPISSAKLSPVSLPYLLTCQLLTHSYLHFNFVFLERVQAHLESHLHDILFVQGRCASGFYEYRSSCYTLIYHPKLSSRTAELKPDGITTACSETVLTRNCTDETFGTVLCPIPMSPRDYKHASFQRSLIDKFGDSAESAWVGLKGDKLHVYVSDLFFHLMDRS